MSTDAEEKVPLVSSISTQGGHRKSDGYLLLSVPQGENGCIQKLQRIGDYATTIVTVSVASLIIILIIFITYHADITELANRSVSVKSPNPNSEDSIIVSIPLGRLKGHIGKSREGRDFISFYKVPFAKPPIDKLRFKDPQSVEAWDEIRDETKAGPQCIQKSKYTDEKILGEEDCLYNNIFVPNTDLSSANFPVMVYIHGGGFDRGNASKYSAEYFMDEDVVLITFEYRLGLLGFLNTGDRQATGNMGFKDQIMLLKWVKEHIKYFGGDASRVTIFGNSVGSTSTNLLMISPMGKDLFHRAISQSGTALCETKSTNIELKPEVIKSAVAQAFNCSQESSQLLECLESVNARDLALFEVPDAKYAVTVEKGFDPNDLSNVFMPEQPYKLLQSRNVNAVPYMIGVMATEMIGASLAILQSEATTNAVNSNFTQFITGYLELEMSPEESQSIKDFYFGESTIGNHTERNLTNLISDCMFVHCSKVTADLFSRDTETYLFYIGKHPKKSYSESLLEHFPFIDKSETVSHADEVQYLFPYPGYPEYRPTDKEYFPFSKLLVQTWAHFAATGNPLLNSQMNDWKPMSVDQKPTVWFELNDNLGLTTILQERMDFLDQFSHKKLTYEL